MENLIEIRCPFKKTRKMDEEVYLCNRVCVKVLPGSAGEARCRSCHLSFEFAVDKDAKSTTGIRVKNSEEQK